MRRASYLHLRSCNARLFWLLACLWPLMATAVPGTDGAAPETVVLGGDSNYPPFQFIDDQQHATGFDVELFRAVAAEAGLRVDVRLDGWAESLQRLSAGTVDVVPMFVTPGRAQDYLFSTPFLRRYHLVFGRKGDAYVDSLAELAGQRVAVQYAGLAWEALVAMGNVAIVPTEVESAALAAVRRGQAEYALVPMNIGYAAIMEHGMDGVVAVSPPLLQSAYVFGVTPGRVQLVQRIDRALKRVQASGVRDRIYLDWLANMRPTRESYRHGLLTGAMIAVPLLVLCVAALVWLRRSRRHAAAHAQRAESEAQRRLELEDRAEYLAFNDADTGLPNGNGLMRTLHECVRHSIHDNSQFAVIRLDLVDLDVLRALGGDAMERTVMRTVATRLGREIPEATVSSIGHGAFALVVADIADTAAAGRIMVRIIDVVQSRIDVDDLPLEQRCHAGLAVFPEHGDNAEALLRAASMACTAARDRRCASMIYQRELEPDPRNLTLLADLREAIAAGKVGYAVQPKLDLREGRIIGAELLVRWQHDRYGALAPGEFIPLAEKTGIIGAMTEYLITRATAHCNDWHTKGHDLSLSVNVSVNDLADRDLVTSIIGATGSIAHKLILEVTESDLMRDSEEVLASVHRLRGHGLRISLDDFGTGYSSFTYLKRLAPGELKLDRSFVRDVLRSPSDQAIVRASIDLAHSLGAVVTAEGIEDAATLQWFADSGCDAAQGNVIAQPMPVEKFLDWVVESARKTKV